VTESTPTSKAGARVQVFIPTYNRADRLEKAVESVLGQTWPGVEVVVLDNHSTDHTPDVVQRLMGRDLRVSHVRHRENIGMIANFNAVPSLVDGDFFAMLTDDDTYEPNFVANALTLFNDFPDVDLVASDAPTRRDGVVQGSQLDYWREGRYAAGAGVVKCLLGHYPIITNCLFRARLRDAFRFEPGLGNTGDGFILTSVTANHAIAVSRYVSGYWNNDGDNASSLQAFDPVLVARIAVAEYALYRGLAGQGRFAGHWLALAWVKRGLSVLVAADKGGFAKVRAGAGLDQAFGPAARACLAVIARTHAIRLFPWILSAMRRRSRAHIRRIGTRPAR
jgi:glycosyltransferase involved in cell wall biosynthesis